MCEVGGGIAVVCSPTSGGVLCMVKLSTVASKMIRWFTMLDAPSPYVVLYIVMSNIDHAKA